ncbi:MAG: rod shape-determining protein RodA [Candidatus Moranbacteria bacterium]|nr:rod shape-determining protein RodA [Candidatus Moranbacteria bacterium]
MKRLLQIDWFLVLSALFVFVTGLLSLYSISVNGEGNSLVGSYFFKQALFGTIGIAALLSISFLDYRHIGRFSTPIYFLTLVVLLFAVVFGKTVRGTSGWISFGFFQFQPVEGAKIALLLFLARFIAEKRSELGEWVRIIASLVLSSVYIFLVLRQPDFGSALTLAALWGGMILLSGIRWKHIAVLALLGMALSFSGWFFLEGYQKDRIEVFLHPEADPRGSGYNVIQAMVAIGSGGVFGKGVGYGSQSQLNFLPEKHTDFIFAVIGEELGLVGVSAVLFAYGIMLFRIYRIALQARDNAGYLLSVGAMVYFLFQILVNVGMNLGIFPVTGLPAPFLSYGGSSLVASFVILGLVLSVYRHRKADSLSVPGWASKDDFLLP